MATWVVSCAYELAAPLERYVRACDAQAGVTHVRDGREMRARLRTDLAGAYALVGDGAGGESGLDAVNIAAAVAADGRAAEVVLVTRSGSGSLRSRAKRAGVDRVLDLSELGGLFDGCGHEPAFGTGPGGARAQGPSAAERDGRWGDAEAAYGEAPGAGCGQRGRGDMGCGQGGRSAVGRAQGERPDSGCGQCGHGGAGCAQDGRGDARLAGSEAQDERASSATSCATGLMAPQQPKATRREGVPVLAFVSGRGGVGKSTLVALAAHMAAAWGMDVACLDLDLAFGNLFSLCGAQRHVDLAQAADGAASDEALEGLGIAAAEHVHVWGPCKSPEYAEAVQPLAADLVARLTHSHDLVLVDTSASWGDATACAAQLADRLVIVSDERPGAIPALARCGGLAVRLGIARTRIVRLMNGCDPRMRDSSFVARAAVGLECAREIRVPDGGIEVVELMNTGKAADLMALDNPMPAAVAHGLAQLLKELGALPECEAAAKALEGKQRSRKLFARMREAS